MGSEITKKLFAKNALKGNGTGKKGKGLVIRVASKKDQELLYSISRQAELPVRQYVSLQHRRA